MSSKQIKHSSHNCSSERHAPVQRDRLPYADRLTRTPAVSPLLLGCMADNGKADGTKAAAAARGRAALDAFRARKAGRAEQPPPPPPEAHASELSSPEAHPLSAASEADTVSSPTHPQSPLCDAVFAAEQPPAASDELLALRLAIVELRARLETVELEREDALEQREAARGTAQLAHDAATAAAAERDQALCVAAAAKCSEETAVTERAVAQAATVQAERRADAAQAVAAEHGAAAATASARAVQAEERAAALEARCRDALSERDASARRAEDALAKAKLAEKAAGEALDEQMRAEEEARETRAQLQRLISQRASEEMAMTASPRVADVLVEEDRSAMVEELVRAREATARARDAQAEAEAALVEAFRRADAAEAALAVAQTESIAARDAEAATSASLAEARQLLSLQTAASDDTLHRLNSELAAAMILAEHRAEELAAVSASAAAAAAAAGTCEARSADVSSASSEAAELRILRLEAVQSRLLGEIDAQGAEVERIYEELCATQRTGEELRAEAESLMAQNARLREMLLEQAEWDSGGTPRTPRPLLRDVDDEELSQLRADREAMHVALAAAARREEELERALDAATVVTTVSPALPAILGDIEARLLRLQAPAGGLQAAAGASCRVPVVSF